MTIILRINNILYIFVAFACVDYLLSCKNDLKQIRQFRSSYCKVVHWNCFSCAQYVSCARSIHMCAFHNEKDLRSNRNWRQHCWEGRHNNKNTYEWYENIIHGKIICTNKFRLQIDRIQIQQTNAFNIDFEIHFKPNFKQICNFLREIWCTRILIILL